VRVKICGITSVADADAAVRAGADAIGLNFVPDSPRFVEEAVAADIRQAVPPFVHVVGVFANLEMREVHRLATRLELHYIQLHGQERADSLWHYKCPVIRAIRVRDNESLEELERWDDVASAVLLDGLGRMDSHGGSMFDWTLIDAARQRTSRPIMVAGGLNAENVAAAIKTTRPFGVDVASGVELEPGKKDERLMRAFVRHAKAAGYEVVS